MQKNKANMLSVLIPTKDYDCSGLIKELHKQGEALSVPYEIIVGEDGTSATCLQKNIIAETLPNCRRVIQAKNVGRANIRNILATEAQYNNILFIDSDAVVEHDNFLANYIDALKNHDVVCGGLYHAKILADKRCSLRFKYEKKADKRRSAEQRNLNPYNEFSTFNFAIKRELFMSLLFNPEIKQYGHEDTLFGKELEKRKINIIHIDNRLLHNGLESNEIFLSKVEQSVKTLYGIREEIGATPLTRTADRLCRLHLKGLFMFFWRATKGFMLKNLKSGTPSLFLLNVYKLGYYLQFIA